MADEKEGWIERYKREMAEAREQAAIRELERRIAKGEFPDNDDTVKAFCAGFYTAYTFQWEQKINREQPGEPSRMGSMMFMIIGLLLVVCYAFVLYERVPMSPQAPLMPILGVGLLVMSYLLSKRSKRQHAEADSTFADKWGKKEKAGD